MSIVWKFFPLVLSGSYFVFVLAGLLYSLFFTWMVCVSLDTGPLKAQPWLQWSKEGKKTSERTSASADCEEAGRVRDGMRIG